MVIFLVSILVVYVIGICLYKYCIENHKDAFGNHGYIGYTYISMAAYYFIALIIIAVSMLVLKPRLEDYLSGLFLGEEIVDSGLLFAIMLVAIGVFISSAYGMLYRVCEKKFADRSMFENLSEAEQRWLMILSCITLSISYWSMGEKMEALTMAAIILGKFFWMDFRVTDFKDIWISVNALPIVFLVIAFMFLVLVIGVVVFPQHVGKMVFGLCGGIFLAILTCAYKSNR